MSRDVAAFGDALSARVKDLSVCIEMQFVSGPVRVTTSELTRTIDGADFAPGMILSISQQALTETTDLRAVGLEVRLGASSTLLAKALTPSDYQGRRMTLWFGIGAVDLMVWAGYMERCDIKRTAEEHYVVVHGENRLRDLDRFYGGYYTAAEMNRRRPGDTFGNYTAHLPERINHLKWGGGG